MLMSLTVAWLWLYRLVQRYERASVRDGFVLSQTEQIKNSKCISSAPTSELVIYYDFCVFYFQVENNQLLITNIWIRMVRQ